MISAVGRAIRRACSAGAGHLGAGTGRFAPGRVGNARAAYRAAADNLLALLEAVISAVHEASWTLQAKRLLFTLRVRHLLRTGHGNGQKYPSAHEDRSCIVVTACPRVRCAQSELLATRSTLQTMLATN